MVSSQPSWRVCTTCRAREENADTGWWPQPVLIGTRIYCSPACALVLSHAETNECEHMRAGLPMLSSVRIDSSGDVQTFKLCAYCAARVAAQLTRSLGS